MLPQRSRLEHSVLVRETEYEAGEVKRGQIMEGLEFSVKNLRPYPLYNVEPMRGFK